MEIDLHEKSDYIFDDYKHLNSAVFYSVTRIPGKEVSESEFEYFKYGCNCPNSQCTKQNNCSCLKYGVNYILTGEGLMLDRDKFGNVPVFECNLRCSCFNDLKKFYKNTKLNIVKTPGLCPNRNVQFGPINCLEIFDAGAKGLGLRTTRRIQSGTFICEYAGEVISLEETKKRQKIAGSKKEMNFIFILKEYTGDNLCKVTCVDPTHIGNIGRYINHSCQPNSAMVPVRVNDGVPWLCVFALRNIEENEEISYDYSGHKWNDTTETEESSRKPCLCGAITCKKFLPFFN